ncbi:MAG: hypothetical protein NXI31_01115 [bacterium]|nr:hypothetical protein [bacterium]
MNAFDYDRILPLVADHQLKGRTLAVSFACPTTGVTASAQHEIDVNGPLGQTTKHRVKRSFFHAIRGPLSSAIRSLFGYSTAGRLAGDVASQVAYVAATPKSSMAISDAEHQAGIIAAFRSVADRFAWDPTAGTWQGRTAAAVG